MILKARTPGLVLAMMVTIGVFALPSEAATSTARASNASTRFSPKYDFAGHWLADGEPTPSNVTRHGKHVVSIYNNSGYQHVFEGDYLDDVTIKGIQIRRSRADHTTTRMKLTIVLQSPSTATVTWLGLDSNSDLAKGQTGVSLLKRSGTQSNR